MITINEDFNRIRRRRRQQEQQRRSLWAGVLLLLVTVTRPTFAAVDSRRAEPTTTHLRRRLQAMTDVNRLNGQLQETVDNSQLEEEPFSDRPTAPPQQQSVAPNTKPTKKKDHGQPTSNVTVSGSGNDGSLEEPGASDEMGEDSNTYDEESPPDDVGEEEHGEQLPSSENATNEEDNSVVENQTDPPTATKTQNPTKSPGSANSSASQQDHTLPDTTPPTRSSEVSDDDRNKFDSKEELLRGDKNLDANVTAIGGVGAALALAAMIFTAWQMSDNPDGVYAAACRLVITVIGLFIRIVMTPCRYCCCHGASRYAGHMPVHTMDYGFRDPALELS